MTDLPLFDSSAASVGGAVSPASVTMSSIWYQRSEHPMRIGTWITMNGLAQIVGALLMYGMWKNSSLSLVPWRTLFIVCGALTLTIGGRVLLCDAKRP